MDVIQQEIRSFVADELGRDLNGIGDDASLLEAGVLDSLGVLQLVGFIEERYGLRVPDDQLMPEQFESIETIANLVSDHLLTSR
jgi:acyl carrier protein